LLQKERPLLRAVQLWRHDFTSQHTQQCRILPNAVRNPWILFITDNVKCAGKVDMHAWAQTLGSLCLPCSRGGSDLGSSAFSSCWHCLPPLLPCMARMHGMHACMHASFPPVRASTKELPCHAGWNTNLTSVKNQWKETQLARQTPVMCPEKERVTCSSIFSFRNRFF